MPPLLLGYLTKVLPKMPVALSIAHTATQLLYFVRLFFNELKFSNLLPVHLIEYGTCPAVLDDVLGDWANKEGYKRYFADSDDLARLSGNNVPSGKFINIRGNKPRSLGVLQIFVQYPSPP